MSTTTKAPKEPQPVTPAKPPKPKAARKPKEPKAPKEAKAPKQAKAPKEAKAPKQPKPAKVPERTLAKLEAALGDGDAAQQCAAITEALGAKAAAKAGATATAARPGAKAAAMAAAAAAVLAATRKGTPVARAYLETLAAPGDEPVAAADVVVRACAKLERGRKRMRAAFVTAWRRASDMAAVDAAYRNFSRVYVEDPEILLAGFEAARRLGNHLAAAERITVLERARDLVPLVEALSGPRAGRPRAHEQLAQLSPEARFHVHARVLAAPAEFDPEVAVAAIVALTGDSRASDMALYSAITDLAAPVREALVEHWRGRVAAGDEAVITRLLALFEWTALRATNAAEFAPYIRALHGIGNRRDVFGQIEVALASDRPIVREAMLASWLADEEAARVFTDAQLDMLLRSVIAIAEGGRETPDQVAAERVLAMIRHPGARRALADAIRSPTPKKNRQLRGAAYRGLARLADPAIATFLIDRLFAEREEYVALRQALVARLDLDVHRQILAALGTRARDAAAVPAAALYAACLAEGERASPRLLVELAHAVTALQPVSNDDARRLRYVYELATVAAIAARRPDDARAFLARARELPDKPYSDLHVVGRDAKTPSALAEAKADVAALESGKLDAALAAQEEAADAARAAGTPSAADDARLGALVGGSVAAHLFDDPSRKVVWFFDELGALNVYDGYDVLPAPFQVTGTRGRGITDQQIAAFFGGKTLIDERATFVDPEARRFRAVIRIADRVLVFDPAVIGDAPIGLRFAGYVAARDAVARFAANPPPGMVRVAPWYLDGEGAVRRSYRLGEATASLAIVGNTIVGRVDIAMPKLGLVHASAEAAVKAYQEWEGKLFAAGGRIVEIVVDPALRRREDTPLVEALDAYARDEGRGAAWQLRGLEEMLDAVHECGLGDRVPDLVVWLGPPVGVEDLDAYQAKLGTAIPDELAEVWRDVGGGGFETGTTTIKFLTPTEVIAAGAQRAADGIDVIATRDGAPLIVFDTAGGRFGVAGSNRWSSLAARIAHDIIGELRADLELRAPELHLLRLGGKPDPAGRRVRLVHGDKAFEAILDGARLLTRTLGAKGPSKPAVKTFADLAAAAAAFEAAVAAARKKGFS